MKYLLIICLQLTFAISTFGQTGEIIELDTNYFQLKDSLSNKLTFEQTVNEINKLCTNDVQRISLIAGWIYNNIDFDLTKFYNGGTVNDYKTVFTNRKGTCGDYSAIFSEFCNRLNIENEIIEGYVPVYNSENKVYYETNHAWNVVTVNGNWYHCDLLGFSGYLRQASFSEYEFIKTPYTNSLFTQALSFLSEHIPADPMWQLSNYPIPLDTLIKYGSDSKVDSTCGYLDYKKEIGEYIKLSEQKKLLRFADNAHRYNKNNHNVVIITNYNASVDLINDWNGDKQKLLLARKYLVKAKNHINNARNGVEVLAPEIEVSLNIIKKYVP